MWVEKDDQSVKPGLWAVSPVSVPKKEVEGVEAETTILQS
jgi:hypothetical protein